MADFPADLAVVGVVVEETKNPDLSEPEVSESGLAGAAGAFLVAPFFGLA